VGVLLPPDFKKMIQIIKPTSLVINDREIVKFLKDNNIKFLKFLFVSNPESCILAKYPDNEKDLTLGRKWLEINYGKRVTTIRTPGFLKEFAGKEIDLYQGKIEKEEFEVFRIKPLNFDIKGKLMIKRRKQNAGLPYFTKAGSCVFPMQYINEHVGERVFDSKASFERMDEFTTERGYILCRVCSNEGGEFTFPLKTTKNGFRTRQMESVLNMIKSAGKELTDFHYVTTKQEVNSGNYLLLFKENHEEQ